MTGLSKKTMICIALVLVAGLTAAQASIAEEYDDGITVLLNEDMLSLNVRIDLSRLTFEENVLQKTTEELVREIAAVSGYETDLLSAAGLFGEDIRPDRLPVKELLDRILMHSGTAEAMTPSARCAGHQAWLDAHTFNVTVTEIYRYDGGNMSSETVYVSPEFVPAFGTDTLKKISSHTIESPENNNFTVICPSAEKTIVVTRQSDPFPWHEFGYAYPCYLWECYDGYAFLEDPINLIWTDTTADAVRKELLDMNPGWVGEGIVEKDYKVYDRKSGEWLSSRSVAESIYRIGGGYHIRLYQLPDNTVVAGAHRDGTPPHEAVQFEPFERYITEMLEKETENGCIIGTAYLGNENMSVQNDGYATIVSATE